MSLPHLRDAFSFSRAPQEAARRFHKCFRRAFLEVMAVMKEILLAGEEAGLEQYRKDEPGEVLQVEGLRRG